VIKCQRNRTGEAEQGNPHLCGLPQGLEAGVIRGTKPPVETAENV
jgi:hypothetical protein